MQPLIIIVGPTAVGKSALALALANELNGEIISCDSVQVYRRLNIGSAKPTLAERKNIPHHLIDYLDLTESYSAAKFQEHASNLITEIRQRSRLPIIVGGTGLYLRGLTDPYRFAPIGSEALRQKWQDYLQAYGNNALYQALKERDAQSAKRFHPHDTARVIRALEVYDITGHPLTRQREFNEKAYPPLTEGTLYLGLTAEREVLYQRINARCRQMLDEGLLEETLAILNAGYSPDLKPLQSIGYRHALWQLYGLVTEEEMLRLMQRDTRHFAKRQLTWFKRDPRIQWFDLSYLGIDPLLKVIVERYDQTCRPRQSRVE